MPVAEGKRLRDKVLEAADKIEDDEMGQTDWEVVG
jgi:ribosome maturation protein SDO1